jgi:hypothetical protein
VEGGSLSPWLSSLLQKRKVKIITKKSTLSFCAVGSEKERTKLFPLDSTPPPFLFRSQLHVSFWLYFDSFMYVRTYKVLVVVVVGGRRSQSSSSFLFWLFLICWERERERQCRKCATRGDISQEVGTRGILSAMRTARYVQHSADFLSNK